MYVLHQICCSWNDEMVWKCEGESMIPASTNSSLDTSCQINTAKREGTSPRQSQAGEAGCGEGLHTQGSLDSSLARNCGAPEMARRPEQVWKHSLHHILCVSLKESPLSNPVELQLQELPHPQDPGARNKNRRALQQLPILHLQDLNINNTYSDQFLES